MSIFNNNEEETENFLQAMKNSKVKIALFDSSKFQGEDLKAEFDKLAKETNKEFIYMKQQSDVVKTLQDIAKQVVTKQVSRSIVIDDYGTLPFMVIGKVKGTIVAQISDEHSAHMTSEHNGATVITLGTKLSSYEDIINISRKYLNEKFAAGRHLVRTDMLVGKSVATKEADFGVCICGTGVGISNAAQKTKGIRTSLVRDASTARDARINYNANVISFGGRITGVGLIQEIISEFINTKYVPTPEKEKIIADIDNLIKKENFNEDMFDEEISK
ncbi:hypothetical protein FQA39_LY12882 [Lamprigera yunnana]|nr:hypothetical protein FQA39_LY12882 [Lamprigera yunnana]